MKEFEQQVAEALTRILWDEQSGIAGLSRARVDADKLAPRVAEAIEAAAWDKDAAAWMVSQVRRAAGLAALRGEPS